MQSYLAIVRLRVGQWPEKDKQAWAEAQKPKKLLGPGGLASSWRPKTIMNIEKAYGTYLGWLKHKGQLDANLPMLERVNEKLIAAFIVEYHLGRSELTVAGAVSRVGFMLRACLPPDGIPGLSKLGYHMMNSAKPSKPKFPKLVPINQLIALGEKLMGEAKPLIGEGAYRDLMKYRDGLLIATFANRPKRLGEIASMRRGDNFIREDQCWRLVLSSSHTKTHIDEEFTFPKSMTEHYDFYFAKVRPQIGKNTLASGEGWVWMGSQGHLINTRISETVTALTTKYLGKSVNPHLFRDCAATTIALESPEQVGITKGVLGHATLQTSQKYYNQAKSFDASAKLADTLAKIAREED